MEETTRTTHILPRPANATGTSRRVKATQEGWYFPESRVNGRYKNEMMNCLSEALAENNLDAVDDLVSEYLARGPFSGPRARDIHTLAPIMDDAVTADNADFAEKLLRRGLFFHDSYVRTALDAHAMRCMTLFLDLGFDLNKPHGVSQMPIWGVSTGAITDRALLFWLLDHGADPNVDTKWDSTTPASHIVKCASPDLVRDLLDDPRHPVDVTKGDLLHHALSRKTDDVVPVLGLLLDHGAPINVGLYSHHLGAQNMYFFMPRGPPLHKAAEEGKLEAVQYLLARHADVSIRDTQGKTALHYAQTEGHDDIVEVLQKAMAESKAQHL